MKEAQITCTCRSIQVSDLGLSLRYGQVVYVDGSAAEASTDLATAFKAGGVKVRYFERCQVHRAAPPAQPVNHPPTPPISLEEWKGVVAPVPPKRAPQAMPVGKVVEMAEEPVAEPELVVPDVKPQSSSKSRKGGSKR